MRSITTIFAVAVGLGAIGALAGTPTAQVAPTRAAADAATPPLVDSPAQGPGHAERLLDAEMAAVLAPGGDLDPLWISLSKSTRNLAWLVSGTPPGWLLGGALPGFEPSSVQRPDLRILTASPVPHHESSGYGWRDDPIQRFRKFHKGTDFKADRGTPVLAAGAGTVIIAKSQNGYGNVVYIDHGGGIVTRYGHLSKIQAKPGQAINAGQQLGLVGATGRATGPHLHFEVRIAGRAVDPVLAMQVAELQRISPEAAAAAEARLAPEVQAASLDEQDNTNRRAKRTGKAAPRPERRGRAPRDRTLM